MIHLCKKKKKIENLSENNVNNIINNMILNIMSKEKKISASNFPILFSFLHV